MIIPNIAYEWLTGRASRVPHGGLSPDVLARIDADRQRAGSLPLIEGNIPVEWTHDLTVGDRFTDHTYRLRRAWRQYAALRFNEQDVYIEVFSGFGFAPGFWVKDLRIYLDGALVGRAWRGACSLGFGGGGGPAVAMLRDGRALRIALHSGDDEKPEVLELLGLTPPWRRHQQTRHAGFAAAYRHRRLYRHAHRDCAGRQQ
jgi:hypothetical protein